MYQIDNATAVPTQPAPTAAGTPGFFTDGSAVGGLPATVVPAEWLNAVQMEIINAIVQSGQTPSKSLFNQLAKATKGRLVNIQRFTSSGTYTPSVGATMALVLAIGAGSAGAGSLAGSTSVGAGGNAGAYGELWIGSGLVPTAITIGAGGTGVVGGSGAAGGATSFGGLMVCGGGPTQANIVTGTPPVMSASLTGSPANVTGTGTILVRGFGALGGPGIGLTSVQAFSGQGANTLWGQGGQQASAAGLDGAGYGAGGSGALTTQGGSSAKGGTGAPGLCIVMEYA